MGRPLLFLDVDGVLNPFGPVCPPGFAEHELFPGEEPVWVNAIRPVTARREHVRQTLEWARGLSGQG